MTIEPVKEPCEKRVLQLFRQFSNKKSTYYKVLSQSSYRRRIKQAQIVVQSPMLSPRFPPACNIQNRPEDLPADILY